MESKSINLSISKYGEFILSEDLPHNYLIEYKTINKDKISSAEDFINLILEPALPEGIKIIIGKTDKVTPNEGIETEFTFHYGKEISDKLYINVFKNRIAISKHVYKSYGRDSKEFIVDIQYNNIINVFNIFSKTFSSVYKNLFLTLKVQDVISEKIGRTVQLHEHRDGEFYFSRNSNESTYFHVEAKSLTDIKLLGISYEDNEGFYYINSIKSNLIKIEELKQQNKEIEELSKLF